LPARHDRWRSLHATQHYYESVRELGLPPWREVDRVPRLRLPRRAYAQAEAFLAEHDSGGGEDAVGEGGPLVGMHPGGAGLAGRKRWPAARFAEVADRLHVELGARVVLLGGPDERALAEEVAGSMRGAPSVVAAGAIPLPVSIALIERCDAFIGDDSGLLHAAAAVGTPYVGIYGPTAIASFRPIPRRPRQGRLVLPWAACPEQTAFIGSDVAWRRPQCEGTCLALETIPVEDVLRAALDLLRVAAARETAGAV
jgi:ADP-heptose:LPS heptosyltransferase